VTEREQFQYVEMRMYIYNRSGGACEAPGCENELRIDTMQLAHRIPQTKQNINKYGRDVIHHRWNLAATCGLKCNAAVDIRSKTECVRRLYEAIKEDLYGE